jgi:hypothetical protein
VKEPIPTCWEPPACLSSSSCATFTSERACGVACLDLLGAAAACTQPRRAASAEGGTWISSRRCLSCLRLRFSDSVSPALPSQTGHQRERLWLAARAFARGTRVVPVLFNIVITVTAKFAGGQFWGAVGRHFHGLRCWCASVRPAQGLLLSCWPLDQLSREVLCRAPPSETRSTPQEILSVIQLTACPRGLRQVCVSGDLPPWGTPVPSL